MKTYRLKHTVEAMRWTDTDEDREAFSTWFENHDALFETRGPIALLPDVVTRGDCDDNRVAPGEWILFTGDDFTAMTDEEFRSDYEEAPPQGASFVEMSF